AVEAVCSAEPAASATVLDRLQSLGEKSLVRQSQDPGAQPRFWMLETIRDYGVERFRQGGEEEEVRRRHAEHFLAFAESAEPELAGENQAVWLGRIAGELDNFRAAFDWFEESGAAEEELRLAGALWRFWATRGDRTEGRLRLDHALARA